MDDYSEQTICHHQEDRQTREVYRYFQPANPAALNTVWPPTDNSASTIDLSRDTDYAVQADEVSETASVRSRPLYSPNKTLTSFAQLAALRLNAERAFITILNRDSQFILAEATRTTNVGSSKLPVMKENELLTGTSTLADAWNICQETVEIQPEEQQNETYSFLIIDDLGKEDRFKRLPFVEGEPHSRFYAGTPLTTDNNINLGCLFVLDPEPRKGLSDIEKDTLGAAAAMVMDYLQVSRQAIEGRRASRLSQGLRLFVDGNSSFADDLPSSRSHSSNNSPSSQVSPCRRASRSTITRDNILNLRSAQTENDDTHLQDGDSQVLSPVPSEELDTGILSSLASSPHSSRQGDNSSTVSSSNDWLFQRAANLLRQSLDLDGAGGVVFLKTDEDSSNSVAGSHCSSATSKTSTPVLALSTRDDPFSYQTDFETSHPAAKFDNVFLSQLFRRYPKGRLWSFHRDGTLSTSDEEQSIGPPQKQNKRSRVSEASKLNDYFPDACQVMFVPLWNATNLQWFGGCFSWTPQPTRVFSRAVDLSSMFGFASSMMTEYSRVESVIADRQKGDFISSISHELRSPLHGVLAAAEFLGGTHLDKFQESLLETVNACGRTLLDTMNQVLDFSKILSLERQRKRSKHRKDPRKPKTPDESPARLDALVPTDLAILAEDVVDSVCLGHSHIQRSTTFTNNPNGISPTSSSPPPTDSNRMVSDLDVEVVVDISENDWLYKVQPGSLRRLVMNLLGNALKYTKKGHVSVSIEATEHSKGRPRRQGLEDIVTLTVADTGKGISSEYLRTRLYTPFAQEDTLTPGTGLGLSIVRDIVRTLNGNIQIQSRVGEGTVVKVTIPLERPVGSNSRPSTLDVQKSATEARTASSRLRQLDLTGKRAAIYGMGSSCLGEHRFWSSIARYITNWYGLRLVPWSADEQLDILFVGENDLSVKECQRLGTTFPNMIFFRNDMGSSSDTRIQWSQFPASISFLRRPCGPEKLARGILDCLGTEPTSPTLRSLIPGRKFVISERLGRSGPVPPVERPTSPPSGSLESTAGELSNPISDSCSFFVDPAECDVPVQSPDANSTRRIKTGITASSPHTPYTPMPSGSAHAESSSEPQMGPRVLLVDDNDINLRLIETLVKKRKVMAVDTAHDGREAVDFAERTIPGYDLIFMDMSMPVMNGFEATRAIRAIERSRNGCVPAKIIAFTGLSSLRDESRALESGVDLFLTKPVSLKEVSRLVDEWESGLSR
ncbi:hypothetical protein N7532_007490 [Penicillium argentinense]|uniref:Uncharacterized protein n=1 Tax=Penicillium argentinense TaxID=1131581 RepID=A0A9W9F7U2_9EURO|nr:uncharacterized protein N7532_007490 [Penicillium argentinense]KAJ5095199.1 hypothetical protein N7532_007490 [Penicillium argentinense]